VLYSLGSSAYAPSWPGFRHPTCRTKAEACLGASQLTLVCGADEKLVSVEEPSRCTYAAQLATPALCTHADHAALR